MDCEKIMLNSYNESSIIMLDDNTFDCAGISLLLTPYKLVQLDVVMCEFEYQW